MTSDINGALGDTVKYSAYGEIRAGGTATDYLYTSQRNEAEIGLDYYLARFYDPVIGHFIQADTIVQDPYTPQDWDKYGYVRNNPVNHNDPSGHMQSENDRFGCQSLACVESDYYWGKKEMDEYYAAVKEYKRAKAERDAEFRKENTGLYLPSGLDSFIPKKPIAGAYSLDYGFFNSRVDSASSLTFSQSFRTTYGTINYATGNKLPIKGPVLAAGFQIIGDIRKGYSFGEITGRALVVTIESTFVGFAAASAGTAVAGVTVETGPASIAYGAITFYSVSVLMAPIVSGLNGTYLFPWVSEVVERGK